MRIHIVNGDNLVTPAESRPLSGAFLDTADRDVLWYLMSAIRRIRWHPIALHLLKPFFLHESRPLDSLNLDFPHLSVSGELELNGPRFV